jgi:uncharacterized protein YndB with AHSA1/START domain
VSAKTTKNRYGSAIVTLPSDTEILITRQFDAPAEAVFKAFTTPDLIKRWWGYATSEWLVCEVDLQVGGTWRYLVKHEDFEVGFHGEYSAIDRPRKLVTTEVYEGMPDAHSVNTITFDEVDGVTTMTELVQHATQEHRDGHIQSGMEAGMQVSLNRLEDVVTAA